MKLANWYSEKQRNIVRFQEAAEGLRIGKVFRRGGNVSHLSPELEEKICPRLGLKVADISSQVIQRDRHAHYLARWRSSRLRSKRLPSRSAHLQRTEVREAEEPSAARNREALQRCRTSGIRWFASRSADWRGWSGQTIRPRSKTSALWHERDISHSRSSE